ncbi:hypothetical protein SIM91_05010 [Rhodococcus opacus]|uniref:hypothetical protein n=1 Tax=Rhodococcus opacus TaxID=37919 RepID=UPI0002A2EEA3|nr:hypothetical protein [Rhodococcus opacus]ELB88169.1 hypothetical protein Rwratislav_36079 [Rhodococcus wratislaviensis IFP 2016]MDX5962683.1 hypothetical protein [Rhodococcus opacus]CAG7636412.1 hypothetical protein E143388_07792 [Rhodococcus opacus]
MPTSAAADTDLAAAVSDAVAAALPAFVEAVTAAVLSDPRLTGRRVDTTTVTPTSDVTAASDLRALLDSNPKHRPSDPDAWIATVAEHYPGAATALAWAWSDRCPTGYWRRGRGAPGTAKNVGRSTRSELDQLLAEHTLATVRDRADLVAGLSGAVETVQAAIADRHTAKVTYTWRRNLLAAAHLTGDDLAKAVAVISWCLRSRPHWQRTITQPPSRAAFEKMLGDWRADGQDWTIADVADPDMAQQLRDLGRTWTRYQSEHGGGAHPSVPRTGRNLHRVLAGDGIDPVSARELAALMRWWFDEGNARFHIRDADFPDPEVVSRALLAMRTSRGAIGANGVAATNAAASGVRAHTDLSELEGLA